MRKFNFNTFKKNQEPATSATPEKPQYSAYRTIMTKHEAITKKLKDEPKQNVAP